VKVSVIVTTYKDLTSLKLVLEGLRRQDYDDFEVVVAEDDNDPKTVEFLKDYQDLEIVHVSHKNVGRTKTVIQNKAILKSTGEYLIFLDGDVIPYKKFISSQVKIAQKGHILAGRRVNLDEVTSLKLKDGRLFADFLEKFYFLFALKFMFDREVRFEQGFYISPDSFIYKKFLSKRKRNTSIIGCNFSCFKDDMLHVNGFDESYEPTTYGDDTDLTWRFKSAGFKLISAKNIANIFHLWHPRTRGEKPKHIEELYKKNKIKNDFRAQKGLSQYVEG